jgi:hypothetical protein
MWQERACGVESLSGYSSSMLLWLFLAAVACLAVLVVTGGFRVRRYSGTHVVAHLAVAGRGLYVSRTADGTWWRLRVRRRQRACEDRRDWGDPPPDGGVREPRHPLGPDPLAAAIELDPPAD